MKITHLVKRIICTALSFSVLFTFTSCLKTNETFTKNDSGNLISSSGIEYVHLANEGILNYLGNLEFTGTVSGENTHSQLIGFPYNTGMFSIKEDKNENILIRYSPSSEWYGIYRKASLPEFDFSVENCSRIELIMGIGDTSEDAIHSYCKDGISDAEEIAEFLSEVRAQENPRDAGLYDLVTNPDGTFEECYVYAIIYGFFEEEPSLALKMQITSYNDLAYSVNIEGKEYVLPQKWLDRLQNN